MDIQCLRLHQWANSPSWYQVSSCPPRNITTAIFNSICNAVSTSTRSSVKTLTLNHHICKEFHNALVKRFSKPHSFVNISIQVNPMDTHALGFSTCFTCLNLIIYYKAMADTGCHFYAWLGQLSCPDWAWTGTISYQSTWPPWCSHLANIQICLIQHRERNPTKLSTWPPQLMNSSSPSKACVALRVISVDYPTIGENPENMCAPMDTTPIHSVSRLGAHATAPNRALPFPASEKNRGCLKEWLLEY